MRRTVLPAVLSCLVLGLGLPAGASASLTQESMFQDDNRLVYDSAENVARTLDTLKSLGADRIRVSVFWRVVAPASDAREKPRFDASDPGAYPPGAWDRYDTVLRLARDRGIGVNFNLTDPAPLWAVGTPEREDIASTYEPSAREFDLFVRAVGTRYSGSYTPVGGDATGPLPRVDYWSIWNEPNQAGWLTPQWTPDPRDASVQIEASPRIYRDLVDGAYDALDATGHGGETILVGETAPKGLNVTGTTRSMKPGRFIRRVFCLDDALAPLQGSSAEVRGCPQGEDARTRFVAAHPGLFKVSGWAHHPYELTFAPTTRPIDPDFYTVGNLPALQRLLRGVFAAYGQPLPGGGSSMPLYLTEFGYQTNPPDPVGVSPANQARYLNTSEYLTARDPSVRTMSQFLLVDDKPLAGFPRSSVGAWGATFQTGLLSLDEKRKPAYASYRLPIHLPKPKVRRGQRLRVWGLVRPAGAGPIKVAVEVRTTRRGSKWRRKKRVTVANERHYVDTRVKVRTSGFVRLAWRAPGGERLVSRNASFKVPAKRRR
jgi:hypothetical protein